MLLSLTRLQTVLIFAGDNLHIIYTGGTHRVSSQFIISHNIDTTKMYRAIEAKWYRLKAVVFPEKEPACVAVVREYVFAAARRVTVFKRLIDNEDIRIERQYDAKI